MFSFVFNSLCIPLILLENFLKVSLFDSLNSLSCSLLNYLLDSLLHSLLDSLLNSLLNSLSKYLLNSLWFSQDEKGTLE